MLKYKNPDAADQIENAINQEELDKVGPLDLDEKGGVKFEQFLRIYKICSLYAHSQFVARREELTAMRRAALEKNNNLHYVQIHD